MERGNRALSKGFIEDSRYTELNTKELKQLLNKNVKTDNQGRVLINKDDEWREETEWDKLIQAVNEDNPDNEDRYCTVEESLRESLKQMKLMREGKIPKRSWNDFMDSLENHTKRLSDLEDDEVKEHKHTIEDKKYFDKNFLFDDDDDLQEVYKEMAEGKKKQDFIEMRKIIEDYFGLNSEVKNIDKERLEQMKIILSVDDEFLSKFKTKEYKRKIDEIKRKAKIASKNIR